MPYELQIRSTNILPNLTDSLRNKMSPYLNSTVRVSQYYRGDKIPANEGIKYPYFLSENLCLVLPKYISAQKSTMICTALAENYRNKILQYFLDLCEQNLRPKDINVGKLEEIQKNIQYKTNQNRIYALTHTPALIHPSIISSQLPDEVTSKSHIFTTNSLRNTAPLIISYTPTLYEETEEPHMLAVKSTLTFEVVTDFTDTVYIRAPIN